MGRANAATRPCTTRCSTISFPASIMACTEHNSVGNVVHEAGSCLRPKGCDHQVSPNKLSLPDWLLDRCRAVVHWNMQQVRASATMQKNAAMKGMHGHHEHRIPCVAPD